MKETTMERPIAEKNQDQTYLQRAKDYTDEKIKEQGDYFLNQIMAGYDVRYRNRMRSRTAIILSVINLLLWILTIVAMLVYMKVFI